MSLGEALLSLACIAALWWLGNRHRRPPSGEDWLGQEYGPAEPQVARPPAAELDGQRSQEPTHARDLAR